MSKWYEVEIIQRLIVTVEVEDHEEYEEAIDYATEEYVVNLGRHYEASASPVSKDMLEASKRYSDEVMPL